MIFTTSLSQMAFLFLLIAIGYGLAKGNYIPDNSEGVLSKLENYIFIPALVMGNFMENFTTDKLAGARDLLLGSLALEIIVIPIAILCARLCSKDRYIRNIYLYGLSFSNFGFMGNAVVSALFPDIFTEYLVFTLVLWTVIYLWGVPVLLLGDEETNHSFNKRLKNFANPMFIGMVVGMVIGIAEIPVPRFAQNLVNTLGSCMSPIAMLLTGMTVARCKLGEVIRTKSIYAVSAIRLVIFPLLFLGVAYFVPMQRTFLVCATCSLAMPLGLNTIVIPAGCGKDTKVASGMAVISHLFSCVTIPIIFAILAMISG